METEKSKWINEIIASGKYLSELHAPNHLYNNIVKTVISEPQSSMLSFNTFKQLLAAAVVLIVVNLGILMYSSGSKESNIHYAYALDSNLSLY